MGVAGVAGSLQTTTKWKPLNFMRATSIKKQHICHAHALAANKMSLHFVMQKTQHPRGKETRRGGITYTHLQCCTLRNVCPGRQAGWQGGRRIRNAANFACFSYLSWRAHSRHKQSDSSSSAGNPGKRCCSPGKRVRDACVCVCVCENYLERSVSGYLAGSDCDYGYSRVLKYLCCLIYVLPALSLSISVSLCV